MSSFKDSKCETCTLFGGANYSFVKDRFGNPHSAIYLNNGYLQIPPGVYIHKEYSVITWIKFISYNFPYNYIWDFGNSNRKINNDVSSFLYVGFSISVQVIEDSLYSLINISPPTSSAAFELNTWYKLVTILKDNYIKINVNDKLSATGIIKILPSETLRSNNFIGQSNSPDQINGINAIYDDLKIFNGALSENEISNF